MFRRSILPEIGDMRCRDLKAEHLRSVLRKLAATGLSYESVNKVRFAMGDMVKKMMAEQYLVFNVAAGLKTPKTARPVHSRRMWKSVSPPCKTDYCFSSSGGRASTNRTRLV